MTLLQGTIIGMALAAPIGPMGLLCINKTLRNGKNDGLVAGLGIALGDFVYGLVAIFLYSIVSIFLTQYHVALTIIGSIVLFFLGIGFIVKKPTTSTAKESSISTLLQTFLLTLSNPTTIFSFVAIAALFSTERPWFLAFGIFLGSMLWWIVLVIIVSFLKNKISEKTITYINVVSGVAVILFGIVTLLKIF